MKIWFNNVIDTDRRLVEVSGDRVRIGRGATNEIVLDSPFVAEEAAVLYRRGNAWELVALGINGVRLGDQQLYNGDRCVVRSNQSISLFPFTLSLDLPQEKQITRDTERERLSQLSGTLINDVHLELLDRMNLKGQAQPKHVTNDEQLLQLERNLDTIVRNHKIFQDGDESGLIDHLAGMGLRDQMLSSVMETTSRGNTEDSLCSQRDWSKFVSAVPEREDELQSTADYVSKLLKLEESESDSERILLIERGFWQSWDTVAKRVHQEFRLYLALRHLKKDVKDIVFGYGPLEDLLRLPAVSEIMVVDRNHIYIEREGRLENTGRRFVSDEVIESIIQRIVGKVSRRIDKSQPMVDARLSDGSRVNAVIHPLAISGPTLTIRKFPYHKLLIDDLVAKGAMTRTVAEFLRAVVLDRRNIIVSGGTGTGKTTLLNCLSDFIPDSERIVTIEDTAELQLSKEHVVRMETKDANVEGKGDYSIRDLVRNALRMRPDRIVVGECRGPESLDMLQAMNTGHDGSLTTIHANSAHEAFLRLEVLVQMAADLPVSSIRQQIGAAVDVVVQLKRLRDGRRIISQVAECVGVNPHTGNLESRDLYRVEDDDPDNTLQPTGRLPTFIGNLIQSGTLSLDYFYQEREAT